MTLIESRATSRGIPQITRLLCTHFPFDAGRAEASEAAAEDSGGMKDGPAGTCPAQMKEASAVERWIAPGSAQCADVGVGTAALLLAACLIGVTERLAARDRLLVHGGPLRRDPSSPPFHPRPRGMEVVRQV